MQDQPLSLFELTQEIKEVLQGNFIFPRWITAEISELHINRSGHCYLELIHKSDKDDQILAKCRATIWSYSFKMLKTFFETSTNQVFKSGIKILVKVSVDYQELYGLSLNIKDIDPSYTLGDIALRRKQIIDQLNEEGIINMNKELMLPLVPQKIAIISSPTAAGYEDFCQQLNNNNYQFKFYHKLFAATMQGTNTEESIINALDKIYTHEDYFDLVIIIRGGGSATDLMSFDSYELAANIAQFPIPILTGIGHERDTTITDIVANTNLKTPTAVAEFIIELTYSFSSRLDELSNNIKEYTSATIREHQDTLKTICHLIPSITNKRIEKDKHLLELAVEKLNSGTKGTIKAHKHELESIVNRTKREAANLLHTQKKGIQNVIPIIKLASKSILEKKKYELNGYNAQNKLNDPINILKKGFSITYLNGKALKTTKEIEPGSEIITQLLDGQITSKVKE